MFNQLFSIIFPVMSIILIGYLYAKRCRPDMSTVNKLNMDLFTPALIFSVLASKDFNLTEYSEIALGTLFVIIGSGVLAWPIAKLLKVDVKTFVPPMMFTNTGNMGLPLALFAFGEKILPAAVVIFIIENTLHFSLGFKMMDRKAPFIEIFKIPIIIATIAGLLISIFQVSIPIALITPIDMIGQVAIPVMLFALGVRLIGIKNSDWSIGLISAVVCPATGIIVAIVYHQLFPIPESQFALFILFAAMPPAVLNFMVAEKYQQEPSKVASIVMTGNLMSILVIPLVLFFVL